MAYGPGTRTTKIFIITMSHAHLFGLDTINTSYSTVLLLLLLPLPPFCSCLHPPNPLTACLLVRRHAPITIVLPDKL